MDCSDLVKVICYNSCTSGLNIEWLCREWLLSQWSHCSSLLAEEGIGKAFLCHSGSFKN